MEVVDRHYFLESHDQDIFNAIRAWGEMRKRLEAGEVTELEYVTWRDGTRRRSGWVDSRPSQNARAGGAIPACPLERCERRVLEDLGQSPRSDVHAPAVELIGRVSSHELEAGEGRAART